MCVLTVNKFYDGSYVNVSFVLLLRCCLKLIIFTTEKSFVSEVHAWGTNHEKSGQFIINHLRSLGLRDLKKNYKKNSNQKIHRVSNIFSSSIY